MYKCDRCGKTAEDAYNITRWFNGAPIIETVCLECISKIGGTDGITDNISDLSDGDNSGLDREG